MPWDELGVVFWQSGQLVSDHASGVLRLDVSAVAIDGPSERGVHVVAHAYAEADGGTIPPTLAQAIRRSLQTRGYELFARRRGGAPSALLQVGGSKTLRSPAAAARECALVRDGIASAINAR
jgi:hypothetical protein